MGGPYGVSVPSAPVATPRGVAMPQECSHHDQRQRVTHDPVAVGKDIMRRRDDQIEIRSPTPWLPDHNDARPATGGPLRRLDV